MRRIVITVQGGLIQDISSSEPIECLVIDYDTEGADADQLTSIPQDDGTTAEAYAYRAISQTMPTRVGRLFNAVLG
jgi:hypothetical protein